MLVTTARTLYACVALVSRPVNSHIRGATAASSRTSATTMIFPDLFGLAGGKPAGGGGVTLPSDSAPTWDTLKASVTATAIGARLSEERALQAKGLGPPHTDAKVRLFDAKSEDDIRVTLYRDMAAWCPCASAERWTRTLA